MFRHVPPARISADDTLLHLVVDTATHPADCRPTDCRTVRMSLARSRTRRWSTTALVLSGYGVAGCREFCFFVHTFGLLAGPWLSLSLGALVSCDSSAISISAV